MSRARTGPLVLDVVDLLRTPGSGRNVRIETSIAALEIGDARLADCPVVVTLRLDVLTDGIVVRGTIDASWSGVCRRCLVDVAGPLVVDLEELYQVVLRDPDAFPIIEHQIDLEPAVRETLLLEAPSSPLCSDGCGGFCPVCGIERNSASCNCDTQVRDDRWAALDASKPESR